MPRRVALFLVDALVLIGLGFVGMWLFGIETPALKAAEIEPFRPAPQLEATQDAPWQTVPSGQVSVSARVISESDASLIMPGDRVDIVRKPGAAPVLRSAAIISIEPPLMEGDDRLHVTFAMPYEDASTLKSLRDHELLYMRQAGIYASAARSSFEAPTPAEVITLKFERRGWLKRLSAE